MDTDPADVRTPKHDLARMHTGPYVNTQGTRFLAEFPGEADSVSTTTEQCEDAVAGGLDQFAASNPDQTQRRGVMSIEKLPPGPVTRLHGPSG
jgi:hypothetical protein